ncbi:uncharacterized protein LOC141665711 [Apium graveolens]|uniref:uncharacterized protein LOC141665711 n=1 Tax=Apium graveolens TaxID=4045 RepID=UPI003D7B827A
MLNFQVVKATSTYNAIMGRTRIHAFKVMPSTYRMVLKFPTRNGIGEAKGDQKMVRSCYVTALRPDGTGVQPLKGQMTTFLHENSDVFAWTAADMPGIDPNLITHRLNIDPTRKVVKQKKRTYAPDRLEAMKQEVKKLLEAGFIEENAGATYQRLVNKIFAHLIGKTKEVYVHDMSGKFLGYMVSKRGIEANPNKIKSILDMEPPHSIKDIQKLTGRITALGKFISKFGDKFHPFFKTLKKLDFPTMNKEAEYEALIAGLGLARAMRATNLNVCGDSRLLVAQVNGEFEAKDDTMAKYLRIVKGILTQFDEWYAEHVPREENTTADALS